MKIQRLSLTAIPKDPIVASTFVGSKILLASSTGKINFLDILKDERDGTVVSKPSNLRKGPRLASTQVVHCNLKLLASSEGSHAAVVRSTEVQLLSTETPAITATIAMQKGSAEISAVSYGPRGKTLAIGLADNTLLLYNTSTRHQIEMPDSLTKILPSKLVKMPGSLLAVSFIPDEERLAAFVATSSRLLFVDFKAAAKLPPAVVGTHKERRFQKANEPKDGAGDNARLIEFEDVCLACAFTSPHSLVLISKDWQAVLEDFPPPVYRRRFGS